MPNNGPFWQYAAPFSVVVQNTSLRDLCGSVFQLQLRRLLETARRVGGEMLCLKFSSRVETTEASSVRFVSAALRPKQHADQQVVDRMTSHGDAESSQHKQRGKENSREHPKAKRK